MDINFKIFKELKERSFFGRADRVIAGVSGGVDSCVMLGLLVRLKELLGFQLVVAHVNYGLRGKESVRDEKFVRKIAKRYGLPVYVKKCRSAELDRGNLQNVARDIRFKFFTELAKKLRANKIALAHNANDQAETVLLHLARGAGIKGLSGISALKMISKGLFLTRPLLAYSRDEVETYAKEMDIDFVEDSTNSTRKYSRNVIRHDIIPMFLKQNPLFIKHLSKTAALLKEEDAFLEEASSKAFSAVSKKKRHEVVINGLKFIQYGPAIKRRILRSAYSALTGDTRDLLTDHIDKMMSIACSDKKYGEYSLPKGIKFVRKGKEFSLKMHVKL